MSPISSAPALGLLRDVLDPDRQAGSRHRLPVDLTDAFVNDPGRTARYTHMVGDLRVDFSKHLIDDRISQLLNQLAGQREVVEHLEALFVGEHVNISEDRAALHTALRRRIDEPLDVDGQEVVQPVHEVLDAMSTMAERVRDGSWLLTTGETVTDVVNIGIGGSDLGPAMAKLALTNWSIPSIAFHFVSNVDPDDLTDLLDRLDARRTLFVIASKTFTTAETITNARAARAWLIGQLGDGARIDRHFVAVSTNREQVTQFGIDPANMFVFWDWVGGRYSVGSAIGLSVMMAIGPTRFREFLDGFRKIDHHVRSAEIEANLPIQMALLGVWYRNLLGAQSHAVLPYSKSLARFPAYLQQLEMESNGKSVTADGMAIDENTSPILWGESGTNGQHAFYQLLHQGTTLVPIDFIGFARPTNEHSPDSQHDLLIANLFAQAEALAFGRTAQEARAVGIADSQLPHRTFAGNMPSTMILAPALTPSVLGQLIALYEHKVAAQGILWGVNSFDQWGVELGKQLATVIAGELAEPTEGRRDHDQSTNAAMDWYLNNRSAR